MGRVSGKNCIGGVFPTLEVQPDDWFLIGDGETDEQAVAVKIQEQKVRSEAASAKTHKFFVTISRRAGFRRLHLTGCFEAFKLHGGQASG
jgi:hypothetical protein